MSPGAARRARSRHERGVRRLPYGFGSVSSGQTADGYTASTSIDAGLFQNAGLTLRVETPAGTIQGVVLPTGHNAGAALTAAGLEKVSENFYVDTTDRVTSTTVTVAPAGKSGTASRGAVSGLQVALYGQPE